MRLCTVGLVVTLALVRLLLSSTSGAQPATKVHRIGWLSASGRPSGSVTAIGAFQQGLRDLGYVEGQNLVIEQRYAEGDDERLPALANALRLTALIVLGTAVSPAVAQGGFHSQAGWIAFLLVGLGLIVVTQRCSLFTVIIPSPSVPASAQYATALLGPLLVLMATMVLTSALSSRVDYLYPVRVVTTSGALWAFRKAYRPRTWTWSWPALVLGITVFGVWMLLEPAEPHRSTVVAASLATLPGGLRLVWIGFRVLGSVLIIPVAEELAFRGYVLPRLVAPDVATVRPGQCPWWAWLGSSLLFGVLHGRWLAGTLAGIGYALALRQRGQLADAIVAHMTTNALIAAYVLSHRAWALWL